MKPNPTYSLKQWLGRVLLNPSHIQIAEATILRQAANNQLQFVGLASSPALDNHITRDGEALAEVEPGNCPVIPAFGIKVTKRESVQHHIVVCQFASGQAIYNIDVHRVPVCDWACRRK